MAQLLLDHFCIDVVCSATDLGESDILKGIRPDQWNPITPTSHVLYLHKSGAAGVLEAIVKRKPDVIYINGIFLPLYSWLPLLIARIKNIPVVFSPRGMLQQGALSGKFLKKHVAIALLKALQLHKGVLWHATDEQESADIRNRMNASAPVKVIGNVPRRPGDGQIPVKKESGQLKLIFLSVIARKKNLDLILNILEKISEPVTLDIYGPIKDRSYWDDCLPLMQNQSHYIRYAGPINPAEVSQTLKNYHAFILLTKGENFGHAIYEALSVGTPAIISQYTPWGNLQDRSAGVTVDIRDHTACCDVIRKFLSLNQEQFDKLSRGAFDLANEYYHRHDFKRMYIDLFTDASSFRRRKGGGPQHNRTLRVANTNKSETK